LSGSHTVLSLDTRSMENGPKPTFMLTATVTSPVALSNSSETSTVTKLSLSSSLYWYDPEMAPLKVYAGSSQGSTGRSQHVHLYTLTSMSTSESVCSPMVILLMSM